MMPVVGRDGLHASSTPHSNQPGGGQRWAACGSGSPVISKLQMPISASSTPHSNQPGGGQRKTRLVLDQDLKVAGCGVHSALQEGRGRRGRQDSNTLRPCMRCALMPPPCSGREWEDEHLAPPNCMHSGSGAARRCRMGRTAVALSHVGCRVCWTGGMSGKGSIE